MDDAAGFVGNGGRQPNGNRAVDRGVPSQGFIGKLDLLKAAPCRAFGVQGFVHVHGLAGAGQEVFTVDHQRRKKQQAVISIVSQF